MAVLLLHPEQQNILKTKQYLLAPHFHQACHLQYLVLSTDTHFSIVVAFSVNQTQEVYVKPGAKVNAWTKYLSYRQDIYDQQK